MGVLRRSLVLFPTALLLSTAVSAMPMTERFTNTFIIGDRSSVNGDFPDSGVNGGDLSITDTVALSQFDGSQGTLTGVTIELVQFTFNGGQDARNNTASDNDGVATLLTGAVDINAAGLAGPIDGAVESFTLDTFDFGADPLAAGSTVSMSDSVVRDFANPGLGDGLSGVVGSGSFAAYTGVGTIDVDVFLDLLHDEAEAETFDGSTYGTLGTEDIVGENFLYSGNVTVAVIYEFDAVSAVPTATSAALLPLGALLLGAGMRRRNKQA